MDFCAAIFHQMQALLEFWSQELSPFIYIYRVYKPTQMIQAPVVHTSRVIITYRLVSLSSLTYITHNLQVTIILRKRK